MDCNQVRPELRVKITKLNSSLGFMIKPNHITVRKEGIIGTVTGYVPGHGGDVWWVKHEGSDDVGAYCFDEFEPVTIGAWDPKCSIAYRAISGYYKDKKAARSGVPYINHIDEGLTVMKAIEATQNAMMAYCLHPLVQADDALANALEGLTREREWLDVGSISSSGAANLSVVILAMEYRRVANAYLSGMTPPIFLLQKKMLPEVRQMLIADKVQNYKDFVTFHLGKHERSAELETYFYTWFEILGVHMEQYRQLAKAIDAAK
jgi:hypothetical protein